MRLLTAVLALSLPFGSCKNAVLPTQPPAATQLGKAQDDRDSKISAYSEATETAINTMADSPSKTAAFESNSVVRRLAGPATDKDRLDAQKLVNLALSGKLADAQKGWAAARTDADTKNDVIAGLEKKLKEQQTQAALDLQAKLDQNQRKWQTAIFMGGGALGVVIGIIILVLVANPATALTYGFLGPRAGFACIGAGLALILIGVAINSVERLIDNHPWIFGGAVAIALGLGLTAAVLSYANHHNHVNSAK